MKKNRILLCLLCILLIAFAYNPVFASSNSGEPISQLSTPGDTLSKSQNEYVSITNNAISQNIGDNKKIEAICEEFLTLSKASVRDPQNYDNTLRIGKNSLKNDKIQYRLTGYQYQAALNNALGWEISKDNLVFSDFTLLNQSKNTATASIIEKYTYYINDGFDDESYRSKKYTFELLRDSDGWKITNVTTDDPWETDTNFKYEPIDVTNAVNAHIKENKEVAASPASADESKPFVVAPTAWYQWTYHPSLAVSYAVAHYADTTNSVFGYHSGNNCQNFASQCVWAGLKGTGSNKEARPAVPISRVGASAPNVWCVNQATTAYGFPYNYSWDNVIAFANLLIRSGPEYGEGPYGNAYFSNGVQNAEVGNVLTVDWDGSPSLTTIDHAMFVTQVSGTSGSRTKDQVKVAAHTKHSNTAYEVLSQYTPQSIGSFGRDVIWSGNYTAAQP
ncbi:amidase domain-containing protein [Desulfosporosinus youngiae]|uniref:Putative amidase domain-containing protein n=1 Tax=Desulfosporosinus youngiae DSM 17734 TaxID=768710 RepID=H5XVP1_9FIRM|nr:amidase domain-containing protein [Desulfosporosinus youngiae]EHQ90124.1 hypothetical protein DesyoDRAFT_3087 [Desulfosporosinus youngiae DSM 17734]